MSDPSVEIWSHKVTLAHLLGIARHQVCEATIAIQIAYAPLDITLLGVTSGLASNIPMSKP